MYRMMLISKNGDIITAAVCEAGNMYPYRTPEFIPGFQKLVLKLFEYFF